MTYGQRPKRIFEYRGGWGVQKWPFRGVRTLWMAPYAKEVLSGAESKPLNLFDRAFVHEKRSRNKNIIDINIFGCLSQNAISTGVA